MKIKWIILIIGILLITGLLILLLTKKEKEKETINSIKSIYYSYSDGYAMYAYTIYEINCDDKCTIKIKPNGYPDEEAKTYTLDDKSINDIINVINKYDVLSWDGFNKSDQNVLDGDSFSFSLNTVDGKRVSASGYMMWPEHYREVKTELKEIFDSYIKDGDFKDKRW